MTTLIVALSACGGSKEDGFVARCDPLPVEADGCKGFPKGDPSKATAAYPIGCVVVETQDDVDYYWVCDFPDAVWVLPL